MRNLGHTVAASVAMAGSAGLLVACSDHQVGVYNTAPHVKIDYPEGGETFAPGDTVELRGRATDDQDPAEDLQIEWRSDQEDGVLGTAASVAVGVRGGRIEEKRVCWKAHPA